MVWLEVTIQTSSAGIELLADHLTAVGYDSFIMDDSADFQDFLAENTQYWDYVDEELARQMQNVSRIRLFIEQNDQAPARLEALKQSLEEFRARHPGKDVGSLQIGVSDLREEDWENSWKQYYQPIPVGKKLLIVPQWLTPDNPEHRIPVLLDGAEDGNDHRPGQRQRDPFHRGASSGRGHRRRRGYRS